MKSYYIIENGQISTYSGFMPPSGFIEYEVGNEPQELKDALEYEQNVIKSNEYKILRAAEYPPMADCLDAIVKGDSTAIQTYKDACIAVKKKYPKPS